MDGSHGGGGTPRDTRIVYGASCTWWGTIQEAGTKLVAHVDTFRFPNPKATECERQEIKLPCCPVCWGLLYEMANAAAWRAAAMLYQAAGHDGYFEFTEWMRGKCFRTYPEAIAAYRATGGKVEA
jgi:hypothetical protein